MYVNTGVPTGPDDKPPSRVSYGSLRQLAVRNWLRTIELFPSYAVSYWQLTWACLEMARYELAPAALAVLLQKSAHEYVPPYMIALIQLALDRKEAALSWLETAYEQRAPWMPFIKVDPRTKQLHMEGRCLELLRRLELVPAP